MISALMKRKPPTEETQVNFISWEYFFHFGSIGVTVCQKFLCTLLNIKKGRFASIQKKLLNNKSLQDNRGTRNNRIVRLTDELKKMINEHCLLIPHSESHYSRECTKLLYFDHSDLTMCKLYDLFIEYHTVKTGDSNPPLKKSTYFKYFNHNLNSVRVQVCTIYLFSIVNRWWTQGGKTKKTPVLKRNIIYLLLLLHVEKSYNYGVFTVKQKYK